MSNAMRPCVGTGFHQGFTSSIVDHSNASSVCMLQNPPISIKKVTCTISHIFCSIYQGSYPPSPGEPRHPLTGCSWPQCSSGSRARRIELRSLRPAVPSRIFRSQTHEAWKHASTNEYYSPYVSPRAHMRCIHTHKSLRACVIKSQIA